PGRSARGGGLCFPRPLCFARLPSGGCPPNAPAPADRGPPRRRRNASRGTDRGTRTVGEVPCRGRARGLSATNRDHQDRRTRAREGGGDRRQVDRAFSARAGGL